MKKSMDMRIRKIERIQRRKEDVELEEYRMLARDEDGVNKANFTLAEKPNGNPGDIVSVSIESTQKTLTDKDKTDE